MSRTMPRGLADPAELWTHRVCMHEVSQNLEGDLVLLDRERERCPGDDEDCLTLKTDHLVKARARGHDPCNSGVGGMLDGRFLVRRLVSAFVGGSAERRGTHTGDFVWGGAGLVAEGRISGTTNAGTHRAPVFDECQQCHQPGVMEGVLRGRIVRAEDERMLGCAVLASYRLSFDPSQGFQDTAFTGTIEGLVICPCDDRRCVELNDLAPGANPNPWTLEGFTFEVHDHTGAATASADIASWGGLTGLNANYRTLVKLPTPATTVEITLAHFSSAPTVRALDGGGAVVDAATMTVAGAPETLTLNGPNIVQLDVGAPQDETLVLRICVS